MASISSPGLGSGLDVASLVSQLVTAEGQPTSSRLDRQEAKLQARLSGLGIFKSSLSTFQARLSSLSSAATFGKTGVSVADTNVFSATAQGSAAYGSYTVNITDLAQAHSLVTDQNTPFATTTETLGSGELTIRFGSDPGGSFVQNVDKGTHTISIDSSNNTLDGVRDAINTANIGITATLVNNGTGYLLALTSNATGADAAIEISVDDTGDGNDTDGNGLSRLAYNAGTANLDQTRAAQDAALTINGVGISSTSNAVSGAIEGVNLNLKTTGTSTLTVSRDSNVVRTAVTDFVTAYNALITSTNGLTGYNPETGQAGILNGDAGVRSIISQVKRQVGSAVSGLTGAYTNLSAIGIATQKDGTLKLNDTTLNAAIADNVSEVSKLFAAVGEATSSQVSVVASGSDTRVGSYAVSVSQAATRGSITGNATAALADDGGGNFSSPFVIDADNDSFTIKIDGVTSNPIVLSQGSYNTTAELVAEIQARLNADSVLAANGVAATVAFDAANDKLGITSNRYGSASKLEFTAVDTNTAALLGFETLLTGTDGLDIAGTIGGVAASGSGTVLTATGDAAGLQVEIPGGVSGALGSVNFTRGVADNLNSLVSSLLDDKVFDDRIDAVNSSIDSITSQREALNRRLESVQQRLLTQFTALDVLVSQLQNTSNYITQQLASLPTVGAKTNGK